MHRQLLLYGISATGILPHQLQFDFEAGNIPEWLIIDGYKYYTAKHLQDIKTYYQNNQLRSAFRMTLLKPKFWFSRC
jgi:hypothetical protein